MRILTVHNFYGHYAVGGEGNVWEAESRLLRDHGHEVCQFKCTNSEILEAGLWRRVKAYRDLPWSPYGYELIKQQIDGFTPDVMHVHNYWIILSPAIFQAAKDRKIPTVLTLHNYRLICPGGQLLRGDQVCDWCKDGRPWRVLRYRCYPDRSLLKSFLSLRLYLDTRARGFLSPWVDAYIALSDFGRTQFIQGGLPQEKVYVKPNSMEDPLKGGGPPPLGHGAVFVGRLSPEKGLTPLMRAWKTIDYPLTVVGDGPEMPHLRRIAPSNVEFIGQQPHDRTLDLVAGSAFLVFPSKWYEGFPLSLLEAMAVGRAVVASDLGPRRELVDDGKTGLLFRSGDPDDLRKKVQQLIDDPRRCSTMGLAARHAYLQRYTPEMNYRMLMDVYEMAAENARHRTGSESATLG